MGSRDMSESYFCLNCESWVSGEYLTDDIGALCPHCGRDDLLTEAEHKDAYPELYANE